MSQFAAILKNADFAVKEIDYAMGIIRETVKSTSPHPL